VCGAVSAVRTVNTASGDEMRAAHKMCRAIHYPSCHPFAVIVGILCIVKYA
jgi:hypothetical protein